MCGNFAAQEGVALPVQNSVAIPIDKDMEGPVYVYYVLTDFHQNHKRYVRSVDFDQLHGKTSNPSSPCDPQSRLQAPGAPNEGKINPCGLQAWSFFNDTISNFAVRHTAHGVLLWCSLFGCKRLSKHESDGPVVDDSCRWHCT